MVAKMSVTRSREPTATKPWHRPYAEGSGRSPTAWTDRTVSSMMVKVTTHASQATGVERLREVGGTGAILVPRQRARNAPVESGG